jgi:hypothetical protein
MLRDYTDSYAFEKLSAESERLFVRLIMKADDFGRYHATSTAISSGCFPLVGNLRSNDIVRWLDELSSTGLILRYMVNGRAYLAIVDFKQRLRTMTPKFPAPEGKSWDWQPNKSDVGQMTVNCPTDDGLREEKRREEIGRDKNKEVIIEIVEAWNSTTLPKCLEISQKRISSLSQRLSEEFFKNHWKEAIEKVKVSSFCNGKNDRKWRADIDWFSRPDSVAKIMEGKYDDRKHVNQADFTKGTGAFAP